MVSFGKKLKKAKIKKAENLNQGRSYVITTVLLSSSRKVSKYIHFSVTLPVSFCKICYQEKKSENLS